MTRQRADTVLGPKNAVTGDAVAQLHAHPFAGSPQMQRRLAAVQTSTQFDLPFVLAAEHVTCLTVTLPRTSARKRAAMLAFAVEEKIGTPLASVVVTAGPQTAVPQLVFITRRSILKDCPADAPRVLPEILLIPRPAIGWAVWQTAARTLVRAADGTGFAVSADMFALIWQQSGQPEVNLLGGTLPNTVPHRDLTAKPPLSDPAELTFTLPLNRPGETLRAWRPVIVAGAFLAVGLLAHLGILVADVLALNRIAATERQAAQTIVDTALPGVSVTTDVAPILASLAPNIALATGSPLLGLLADVSEVFATHSSNATFRRLAWGAVENQLVVLVQATGLDDLQEIETELTAQGFDVISGAASASDGGAEAELRIRRTGS